MKFTTLEILESDFDKIGENEKIFYVFIGHLCNEITVLEKLLFLSTTFSNSNENLDAVNASQSLMMSKLTAGKLWEGWELLKAFISIGTNRPKIPISLISDLSTEGKAAFDELKVYFKRGGLFDILRNQFSFHYMPGNLKKQFPDIKDIDKLRILVTEKDEPFSIFSEEVMLKTILNKIDKTDHNKAFEKLIEDVMTVTSTFRIFCADCLIVMIQKYKLKSTRIETELAGLKYNNKLPVPFLFSDYK